MENVAGACVVTDTPLVVKIVDVVVVDKSEVSEDAPVVVKIAYVVVGNIVVSCCPAVVNKISAELVVNTAEVVSGVLDVTTKTFVVVEIFPDVV